MMSMHRKPPGYDTSPTPCYPEQKTLECNLCSRWRSGVPIPAERRQFVIIDASLFMQDGVCPMYEARPSVHPYAEPVEREPLIVEQAHG